MSDLRTGLEALAKDFRTNDFGGYFTDDAEARFYDGQERAFETAAEDIDELLKRFPAATGFTARETALIAALNKINQIIYGKGAPLGSDAYFAIRAEAVDAIKNAGGEIA